MGEKRMVENIMNTKTVRLGELLSAGKTYKVPPFQRNYSWQEENWEDLWEDILNVLNTGTPHYMGALIFKPGDEDDEWTIIDGQQRLATLTIIAVAGIKFLEDLIDQKVNEDGNKERVKLFIDRFIGEKSATSLYFRSKLKLNRKDDPFFQEYILNRKKPSNISKLEESQKLMYKCLNYFYEKIKAQFKNDDGEKISNFLENSILKKLIFIQITVEDDLNAYTVFETLNARGIELAPTDLLKNYLLSLISPTDIELVEDKWYRIMNLVGSKKLPTFLRYYLNSYKKLVRKERLFKEIKNEIKTPKDAEKLLDNLESIALFYSALNNPYDEFWNDFPDKNEIVKTLEILNIFRATQYIPLLISVYKYRKELLPRILKMVLVITFRYNIIGRLNPNELEKTYNSTAIKVKNGNVITAKDIFEGLRKVYIEDKQFVSMFSSASLNTRSSNKKVAKYILLSIEEKLSGHSYSLYDSNITIEHIIPENPTGEWLDKFKGENIKNYIYKIGNLTLLESSKNRHIGNANFSEKKTIYKSSKFKITKIIQDFEHWDRETLYERQKQLAKIAKNIWRLDY